jgi:hypothetical protein
MPYHLAQEGSMLTSSFDTRITPSYWAISVALVAAILLSGCTWEPRMFHPDIYSSGKVLEKGKTEVAAQVVPGGQITCGVGKDAEIKGFVGIMGDDIWGGDITLTKSVYQKSLLYSSLSLGAGAFKADKHDFDGYRLSAGWTGSVYTRNGRFAVHVPFKVYWTHYQWRGLTEFLWINQTGPWIDVENDGVYGVIGLALSVQGKNLALRWGINAPLHERLGEIDFIPMAGLQAAVKF